MPRERLEAWTCTCRPVYYELLAGAGVMWIRRIEGDQVRETHRTATAIVREWWADLLAGQAS
ncbi:hypothetical protein [Nonomuraea rhodomycinica]|uniref:Uncharacterized protein n=1 Tax=Nonomuraea rhodomycinica TaxID=1712872 RepID=A0A7Y6IZG0_9ACTN|nr:hypothetical protein [Nonomuraea rhodomycinica]NUW47010.1 hypothetical protein [Nonomuraea rhodomycinica]